MHHAWQDLILAFGSLIFAAALIPSIIGDSKPALATSVPTAIVLYIFCFDYITLGLWFAAATSFLSASCWAALAIQKARQRAILGSESDYDTKNHRRGKPKGRRR